MAWTSAQLAAAFDSLMSSASPPATLALAAAALTAQTVPGAAVDVPATAVRDGLESTGEWGALMNAIAAGSTTPAAVQAVIQELKTMVDTGGTFQTSLALAQTNVSNALGVLQTAGLVASTTVTALKALWAGTAQPVWGASGIGTGDLQNLQNWGMISKTIPAH